MTNSNQNRRAWLWVLLTVQLFGLLALGAAIELRRATQGEVNSGSRVNAWVGPYELNHWTGAGSPTGGMTQAQAQSSYASGTNTFVGTFQGNASGLTNVPLSGLSTNIIIATNQPFTAGQALVYVGTNNTGQPVFKGTNWPAGGGSSFPLSGDVSAANHAIVGISDMGITNANVQSEAHLTVGATGSGGFVTVAGTASTNSTPALFWFTADKISATTMNLSQANIGTTWLTNTVSPTNAVTGTVVDMSKGYAETNLSGNITYTDISGVTAGAYNAVIRRLFSGGADRTVAFPASWHTNFNFIGVVTNGWTMDLLITVTASRTNVDQILNP